AGVKGKLGRLLGIFENQDRKHRTYVYVLTVTEILEDWEDSVNIGTGSASKRWVSWRKRRKESWCNKVVPSGLKTDEPMNRMDCYRELSKENCSTMMLRKVPPTLHYTKMPSRQRIRIKSYFICKMFKFSYVVVRG
uniref:Uncharacterized protein n=1 Tax=Chelydra serpentina TaxID=8475 RepID=A0A8C3RM88_CHESE